MGLRAPRLSEAKTTTLRRQLGGPAITRVVGVNDGLSAMLAEKHGFGGLWASGLAISAAHGVPDASILTMTEFLAAAHVIDQASDLPVLADCDTGFGDVNVVRRMVREYERAGIAGVCIEDKEFPKRNSFSGGQELADPDEFAAKIRAAKLTQTDPDFVVIARIESLIAGAGLGDALERAECYEQAGADAILIHSKASEPDEVLAFAGEWRQRAEPLPLVAVPTTYYSVNLTALAAAGFAMVIYANQALRAATRAIDDAFDRMRRTESTAGLESDLAPVDAVLELIGMDELESEPAATTGG